MSDGEASQSWAVGTYTGEPDDWSVQHERKEQLLYKTRGMISDLKAQLAASQEQVEAANSQARENAEELEDQKREYEKQLNDLRRSVQDKDDELERLKRDAQRESTASNENSQRLNRALSDLQQQRSQNEHLSSLLAQAQHERDKLQSERDSAYSQLEQIKQSSSDDAQSLQSKVQQLEQERKNRQNDQAAAKEKLERAKQDAQRLHDAEVNRLQEEHEEAIRNVREQLREEHSKEIARVKEDVSENASQEMDTRLGIVRSKLHELGRRESRLLAQIDTLRTQVTDAKHYANEEFKKRSELEGSLREAADVFKRELFAKNEQLQQLQREVNHLREWYVKGMEVVASDVHHLRSTNPSCLSEKAQPPGQAVPQKEAAAGSK